MIWMMSNVNWNKINNVNRRSCLRSVVRNTIMIRCSASWGDLWVFLSRTMCGCILSRDLEMLLHDAHCYGQATRPYSSMYNFIRCIQLQNLHPFALLNHLHRLYVWWQESYKAYNSFLIPFFIHVQVGGIYDYLHFMRIYSRGNVVSCFLLNLILHISIELMLSFVSLDNFFLIFKSFF